MKKNTETSTRKRTVTELRRAMLDAVTDADLKEIVFLLVKMAKSGDRRAIALVLDRCFGRVAINAQDHKSFTHDSGAEPDADINPLCLKD